MRLFRFTQFSSGELTNLCWFRAVEWIAWPAFLSQPLLPLFYIYYPVYWVLLVVVLISFSWLPFRHRVASLQLATLGCFWVRLKWIAIPIAIFFLVRQNRYLAIVLTLATPIAVSLLNAPAQLLAAIAHRPAQIGIVQKKFLALASDSGGLYEPQTPPQSSTAD